MGLLLNFMLGSGTLLVGLIAVAYLFFSRNYNIWTKKGIPFLKPLPFVGNFKDAILSRCNIGVVLKNIYLENKGKPYIGIFGFDTPMLLVRDLDIVKSILVKDFNTFMDRNVSMNEEVDPLTYKSLFVLKGQRWRHLRHKLSPVFTSGKMKRMFELVDKCGKELVIYLDKKSENGFVEVKDSMARYTTDVISSTAFGIDGDALSDDKSVFRAMLKTIFEFSIVKSLLGIAAFFAPALLNVLKLSIISEEVTQFLRKRVWSMVEYREKNGVVRNDFLDLLIQIRKKGHLDDDNTNGLIDNATDKWELDGDDFVAQTFIFLSAGFETSSTTMTFSLYELALNHEIQDRLRNEILSVLEKNDGKVTYDGILEMSYLDQVLSETLRKYPVLPILDRKAVQSYVLPGSTIKLDEGQVVMIPILGIHYDPEYYPEPYRFDPDRFTEENKRLRPNYCYLPFGEGPRMCIGMRMGLMQAKVGLVHVLANFVVDISKNTPVPMQFDPKSFLMNVKGNLPLSFKRITY